MVVGGFPGHGKSTWTMQFAANMAMNHNWGIAIASYEMQIVPYVTDALMSAYARQNIRNVSERQKETATNFVKQHFTFIAPNRSRMDIEHDIDWLLDKMTASVIRFGVKMVLIDPFNEIEHRKAKDESLTEYIGRAIRKLKAFAMHYQVLVCVVVHPTKGSSQIDSADLSLYSLADSSHWANKADIGVIVGRIGNTEYDTLTGIYTKKIRYQPDAGRLGQAVLTFNPVTRLFEE
jgi:twinkle protein